MALTYHHQPWLGGTGEVSGGGRPVSVEVLGVVVAACLDGSGCSQWSTMRSSEAAQFRLGLPRGLNAVRTSPPAQDDQLLNGTGVHSAEARRMSAKLDMNV